jgi:nitrogen regulatory protein PII
MKKIETVIRPSNWEEARAELQALGVAATLREVRTFGRMPARREVYRGSAYVLDTTTELELSMLVPDDSVDATLVALGKVIGDAEIVVTHVERLVCQRQVQTARPVTMLRAATTERPLALPVVMNAARA